MASGRFVIVGCGWIARRHAAAARQLGIPVTFASRDVARARAYAKELGGVAALGGYREALDDADTVAVIVCTPHDRHLPDALAALEAGKHVLVEKPIARTLEEADGMIAAAAGAGRVLMVAENFHYMPAFRHVQHLLDSGCLGALREIHLVARGYRRHAGWRCNEEVTGGGALIDGGIHYVHNLRWWGGEPRRVFALRPPQTLTDLEGEDSVSLLAELPGGVLGFLSNSIGAPGLPRFQWSTITGVEGTCFVDNRGRCVVVRSRGRFQLRLFRRDLRGHEKMLRMFRDAIQFGKNPETDGVAGRGDLAVVLAGYRSLTERRPVDL